MKTSGSLSLVAVVVVLLLAGCDATGSEEAIILNNANSEKDARPTVGYTFEYETNGNRSISVRSSETDDLNSVLATVGFNRDDVLSARIDSVRFKNRSPKSATQKVFDYLTGSTLYLGPNTDGKRIADVAFGMNAGEVTVQGGADVTDIVRNGPTPAFLQLSTAEDVPDRKDRLEVTVYFQIKVPGV